MSEKRIYINEGTDRWRCTFRKPGEAVYADKWIESVGKWQQDRQRKWLETEMSASGFERDER